MTHLVLVSPVPPMKTGTANYLKLIIRDLASTGIKDVTVVYDKDGFVGLEQKPSLQKLSQVMTKGLDLKLILCEKSFFFERWDQTVVYFTANNHYHFYIYDLLLRKKVARRFLVIHEPSCMMAATSYFEWDRVSSRYDYVKHLQAQFGSNAQQLRDDISGGKVIESLQYEILGFDYSRFEADVVFVHSEFARAKLLMESDGMEYADIRVAGHPDEDPYLPTNSIERSNELRFGVFGFVNPAKRIYEVMNGFKLFLENNSVNGISSDNMKLLIVGQMPPAIYYSPRRHARQIGIEKKCEFYGYVDKEKFNELFFSCSLIFNLRFPSCGETTGLAGYGANGPKIVMSDYHAFRELHADYFVDLDEEEKGICEVMSHHYRGLKLSVNTYDTSECITAGFAIGKEYLKSVQ